MGPIYSGLAHENGFEIRERLAVTAVPPRLVPNWIALEAAAPRRPRVRQKCVTMRALQSRKRDVEWNARQSCAREWSRWQGRGHWRARVSWRVEPEDDSRLV